MQRHEREGDLARLQPRGEPVQCLLEGGAHRSCPGGPRRAKAPSGTWHRRPQPANVGLERPQLLLRDLAAEGRHPNRLAIEEEASQRVRLEPLRTPTEDPLPQLALVHDEFREIAAVPWRNVALEAPGIAARAAPARAVAAKAAEPFGDRMSLPGRRILRDVGGGQRAQVGHEVVDLGMGEAPPPGRHPYRRRLEGLSAFGVLPHAPRHAVEDPLPQRCRVDVIEIREGAGEQRRHTRPSVAAETALGQGQIGAALDRADVGRAPPEHGRDSGHSDDAEARGEEAHGEVQRNLDLAIISPFARTTSLPFIPAWPVPQYSAQVKSNVPAWSATNSTVTASPTLRDQSFHPERFDREAVGTVGGAEAEPDAVPLRNRDGRGFELEPGRDDVDRLDVLDVAAAFTCRAHAPAAVAQRASRRMITFLFKNASFDYRIIAPTRGFRVSTSGRLTTSKTGDGTVRSANAIEAPLWLVQKTCSTSFTRTVTMMFARRGGAEPHQIFVTGRWAGFHRAEICRDRSRPQW